MVSKLKGKRLAFALAYIKNGKNGYKAALEVGYSEASARNSASRLMTNDDIQAFIADFESKQIKRTEVTVDKVLMGIDEIASSDLAEAFDEEGNLLPMRQIPEKLRRCIASIEVNEIKEFENGRSHVVGYSKKITLWPKTKAQEMLGRHLKMFTDKVEHSGTVGIADQLKAARARSNNAKKHTP